MGRAFDVSRYFLLGALLLTPFLVCGYNEQSPFELIKLMSISFCTLFAGIAFLIGFWQSNEIKIKVNASIYFLSGIVIVTGLSYLFARNQFEAFWGNYNIPSDGLLSVLVCFFFALLLCQVIDSPEKLGFLNKILITSVLLLGSYGVIQHFGGDPVDWWGYRQMHLNAYGTIGQAVGFATILGAVYPLLLLNYFKQEVQRNVLMAAGFVLITLLGIMYSGSRMPMLLTLVMSGVIAAVYWFKSDSSTKKIKIGIFVIVLGLSQIIYYGENNDNALTHKLRPDVVNTGLQERMQVWKDAFKIWEKHPWVGAGPENFALQLKLVNTKDFNTNQNWALYWHKAHNHLIHYLATLGIIGLLAHLLLAGFVAFQLLMFVFRKKWADESFSQLGYLLGFAFIFLANMTAFNFVLTQLYCFIFPVLYFISLGPTKVKTLSLRTPRLLNSMNIALACALISLFGFEIFKFWNADRNFSMSRRVLEVNHDMNGALTYIEKAIADKDNDCRFYLRKASYFVSIFKYQAKADPSHWNPQGGARDLEKITDQAVACDPQNPESWFYRGRLFADMYVSQIFNGSDIAEKSFIEGQKYSPANPIFPFNLGLLYLSSGRPSGFVSQMRAAIDLKFDYIPVYTQLLRYYYNERNSTEVAKLLNEIEGIKSVSSEFLPELKALMAVSSAAGDLDGTTRLTKVYEKHSKVVEAYEK